MDESIGVSLARVRECIEKTQRNEFSMAEVIREYLGRFCCDLGTPAAYSFNAQFGSLLKRNEDALVIIEIEANRPIKDDHGHETTSSYWKINT